MSSKWLMVPLLLSLQSAMAEWKPVPGKMLTSWGRDLDAGEVWSEYPRPLLVREQWVNLNGPWSYGITGKGAEAPEEWDGKILVPFCPESSLSGVGRLLEPDQALWYRRDLPVKSVAGQKTILHFGAVDYETTVWVNGKEVGRHVGGHTPFSFDITTALEAEGNQLLVRVHDETEGWQLRGKQSLNPRGITATRVSGIWQTVWLEQVPDRHIESLGYENVMPSQNEEGEDEPARIVVRAKLGGEPVKEENLRVTVSSGAREIGKSEGGKPTVDVPGAKLWSPDTPHLYDVKVELLDGGGKVIDSVTSYTALREIGRIRDADGHLRIALNGKEIFLLGTLDQGWWPDGLLTPPSDEAMVSDIRFLKDAGFNMIRKHVKVEPARYYWHCDRLGIAVWQDQVNAGLGVNDPPRGASPQWTRMTPNPQDATWTDEAHEQWVKEYKAMVDHLRDYPSVLIWCPFNEAWGQHRSMEIGKMAVEYDPTRLVCHASGGNFWPVGHIASEHHYPDPRFPFADARFADYIKVSGEMGGLGWVVEGHVWNDGEKNWSYRTAETMEEWKMNYEHMFGSLVSMREMGLAAAVYTQTSDFETEVNGLLTYDRLPKADAAWLKSVNRKVVEDRKAAEPVRKRIQPRAR